MLASSNHYYYLNLVKQINWGQIQFDLKDPEITFLRSYFAFIKLQALVVWVFVSQSTPQVSANQFQL